MFQYDEEEAEITLCINCDAEYTVTRIDDDDQQSHFCPFCGYDHGEDEEEDLDDLE